MTTLELNIFKSLQRNLISSIEDVAAVLIPGMSEKDVERELCKRLVGCGINKYWYPVMVSAGENTSKLFSRRVHLPDNNVIRENDIIIIDSTPLDETETVWGNWCQTVTVGKNTFYYTLCEDVLNITEKLENYTIKKAKKIGDIFDYFNEIIQNANLELIGENIGHSIFVVPVGQTVDRTPITDRLFIDGNHREVRLSGILSIEPQLKRLNPHDGNYYAAKFQRIVIYL